MAIPTGVVSRVELAPAAALFRSLGDPTRLAILRRLALGEARFSELVAEVGQCPDYGIDSCDGDSDEC